MLENISTNLSEIKRKIKLFARRNREKLSTLMVASKMASVVGLIAVVPLISQPKTYQTDIKLDTNSPIPFEMKEKKVNVIAVPSRAEVGSARGINPDAMKTLIQQIAPEYGIDWKLVYAIGYYESGNFNSSLARRNFNFFGRKAGSGIWARWSDPETAIRDQFVYLKEHYINRGIDTPAEIGPIYCEGNTWAAKINSIIAKL